MKKKSTLNYSIPTSGYSNSDVLKIKKETHRLYSTKQIDLDNEIVKRINLSGSESILDIGCGLGDFLTYLRQKGHKGPLVGLDVRQKTLKKIEKRVPLKKLNIKLMAGNATNLPFKDKSFDIVSARHMLCYLNNINKGIEEVKRVLKDSGRLITTANSEKSYPHVHKYLARLQSESYLDPYVYATERFSNENTKEILEKFFNNVEIISLKGALRFPDPQSFLNYFKVRRSVLSPQPNINRWKKAVKQVAKWIEKDFRKEKVFYEPKWASIGICKK